MTHAEKVIHNRLERYVRTLTPELSAEIMRGFNNLRKAFPLAEVEAMLGTASGARIAETILSAERLFPNFAAFGNSTTDATIDAAKKFTIDLPDDIKKLVGGTAASRTFNVLNPNIIEGLRTLESRVMKNLTGSVRQTFLDVMERGMAAGTPHATLARQLRETLGLAPNQAVAVENFEKLLREGDPTALKRVWRDRRFDRTLQRALGKNGTGLSEAQIKRMTDAYRKRAIASNAATHARTAATDAQRLGMKLNWQDVIDRGFVKEREMWKRWSSSGDNRVRPEHVEADGEEVPYNTAFLTGEQIPGEASFNCRCLAIYFRKLKKNRPGDRKPAGGAPVPGVVPPVTPPVAPPPPVEPPPAPVTPSVAPVEPPPAPTPPGGAPIGTTVTGRPAGLSPELTSFLDNEMVAYAEDLKKMQALQAERDRLQKIYLKARKNGRLTPMQETAYLDAQGDARIAFDRFWDSRRSVEGFKDLLLPEAGEAVNLEFIDAAARSRVLKEGAREGADAWARMVHPKWRRETGSARYPMKVKKLPKGERRAFHSNRDNSINMAGSEEARTYVHEMGHVLEGDFFEIREAATEFIARRTKGESLVRLRDLDKARGGSKSYDAWEMTRADKFKDAYAGKRYQNGMTEIISMGLEYMETNPANFLADDPDFFWFIFRLVVRGETSI